MAMQNRLGFVTGCAVAIVIGAFISGTVRADTANCASSKGSYCLLEAALGHVGTLSDPATVVPYLAWIARLYAKSDDRDKATRLFDEAKQKAKSVTPPEHQISLLTYIASHQAKGGLGADAHATFIEAADIAKSNLKGADQWIGTVGPIVRSLVENGERAEAAALLRFTMEEIGHVEDPGERTAHLTLAASVATRNDIPEIAETSLARAWSASREIGAPKTRLAYRLGVAEERMRAGLIAQAKTDLEALVTEAEGTPKTPTREALLATIKMNFYQIATGIDVSDF